VRVLVASLGSRGDVEPYALVAVALAHRGHDVSLCLDRGHLARVPHTDRLAPIALGDLSTEDMIGIVREAYGAPAPGERRRIAFDRFVIDRRAALVARLAELDRDGFDLLVLPAALLFPLAVRRSPGAPLEHHLPYATRVAAVLHLPAATADYEEIAALPCLRLSALDPLFAPRDPAIRAAWQFCGFWIRRAPRPLAPEVERFLAAGPPPLMLTMGSAIGFDPRVAAHVVEAARRRGARTIVQAGWAELDGGPGDHVLAVDDVDFVSLFPRCAAVIAHGGFSTVAHALHAGRALGLLPMVDDQLTTAHSLIRARTCVGMVDPSVLDGPRLDDLVERVLTDRDAHGRATRLAQMLCAGDGVAAACDAIERHVVS
jgi:sterol 3beta-glucosyltransferase